MSRLSLEERAALTRRKHQWLQAEVAAKTRQDVAALLKAIKHLDEAIGFLDGTVSVDSATLNGVRATIRDGLRQLGVEVPE